MNPRVRGRFGWVCVWALGALALAVTSSGQQEPPQKRRVEKDRPAQPQQEEPPGKRRTEKDRPDAERDRQNPPVQRRDADSGDRGGETHRRGKLYLPTRRVYGHVRVSERPRQPDGRINVRRVIARSQRVTPVVLERFQDRRREEINLVIRCYRDRDHSRALEAWARFIDGLTDYPDPIDLDEVIMYVAREGCRFDNDELAYYGRRLDFLQDWQEMLLDYMEDVDRQRDACMSPGRACSERTIQNIERDLVRARSDLDVARTEEQLARDQFDTRLQSAGDYEERFTAIYEEIYNSVEVRIRVSGG
jgi:hypothetical protein